MDLSGIDLRGYEIGRDTYQASELGSIELEHPPFVHRQSGWSRFWAAARRFFDRAVEKGVDR